VSRPRSTGKADAGIVDLDEQALAFVADPDGDPLLAPSPALLALSARSPRRRS
jgi:hypothetical protein